MIVFPEIRLRSIRVAVFRYRVDTPVATSFGTMFDRPAVFVRLEAADGSFGWGEVFANWPAAGAEHRARLLIEDISDLILGKCFKSPSDAFFHLERTTHVRALQCGEWGPFRQVIAGIDQAMHDLYARHLGITVRHMLNHKAPDSVPAYASGIHIGTASETIVECRQAGFKRFKLKVGFNLERDVVTVHQCLDCLQPDEVLYVDANQAWTVEEAVRFSASLADSPIGWIEEPILADAPSRDWEDLKERMHHPLAGGENIAGFDAFSKAVEHAQFTFFQPDIAKWGGFTGCMAVARDVLHAGRVFCPHFLGGAVGLHASANLLAAAGGNGVLEVDVNPNPLRDVAGSLAAFLQDGNWTMSGNVGLGLVDPTLDLEPFETLDLAV